MRLVGAVICKPNGVALAFLLILLVSADITAGLAVRAFDNALAEIVVASRGQKKELTTMLATLWNIATTKSTEEIKVYANVAFVPR